MVKLASWAHTRVPMQVAISLLRELLATLITLKWLRLRVRSCVSHCCRQSGEGALANEARHAKVESACLLAQNIAALQALLYVLKVVSFICVCRDFFCFNHGRWSFFVVDSIQSLILIRSWRYSILLNKNIFHGFLPGEVLLHRFQLLLTHLAAQHLRRLDLRYLNICTHHTTL